MTLLKTLKENKDVRKIFGKREIKIIEKQVSGVNLTQSEKNRLSRDIRKKFEIISKLSRFEDEFKLKKGAGIKRIINDAKEIISEDPLFRRVQKITLYGSAAENKLTFRSDIDISVKFDKITLKETTAFRKRITGKAHDSVDIQVYNNLPEKIKKEIDLKGKQLYETKRQDRGDRKVSR